MVLGSSSDTSTQTTTQLRDTKASYFQNSVQKMGQQHYEVFVQTTTLNPPLKTARVLNLNSTDCQCA